MIEDTLSAAGAAERSMARGGVIWLRRIWLPLLVAALMLGLGFWLRWPTMRYSGFTRQEVYNEFAFKNFAYSDIPSLYYRDVLVRHPRPYFDYDLEYPVGMGYFIYALNFSRSMKPYFLATSAVLAVCGLITAALVARFPRGRIWLMALSPALAFYLNLNWDMFPLLLTVAALLLFVRERDGWGAAMLAAAVWTKFFPIVALPLILVERIREGRRRAAARILAVWTVVSAAINAPVLLGTPEGWLYFFRFSQTRPREVNLWTLFDRWEPSIETINNLSLALLIVGMGICAWAVWRGRSNAFVPATCAALAWFFFVNKVYSPQYSLWIVVLLAVIGAAPALAVAWSAADLLYFGASFSILGISRIATEASDWYYDYALMPAMIIREGMLLLVAGWCLRSILRESEVSQPVPAEAFPARVVPAEG